MENKNPEVKQSARSAAVALFLIICAALALRVFFLQDRTFFIDEAFSHQLAGHSIGDIFAGAASESNPPLPMILFHFWQKWARDEWQLRLLCLILNLVTIPILYGLGNRMGGRAAGLAAAALGAFSTYQIEFSQIYRYPALAILIGSACYYLLWRWIESGRSGFLPAIAAVFILGLYTHYFFIFLVLSANLFVFVWSIRDWKRLASWFASQAVVAAAFAPWILAFMKQSGSELGLIGAGALAAHLKTLPFFAVPNVLQAFIFGPYPVLEHKVFIVIGVIAYAALFCRILFLRESVKKWFLLSNLAVGLILPYFMMLFLGLRLQLMYFCMFSCLLYVIFAISIFMAKNKTGNVLLGLILLSLISISLHYYQSNMHDAENNKTIIRYIEKNAGPDDLVVVNPTYQGSLFNYYMKKPLKLFGIPGDFEILKYNYNDKTQVAPERLAELDRLLPSGAKVWAFYGFGVRTKPDGDAKTYDFLKTHYKPILEKKFAPVSFARDAGLLAVFKKP
jgi:mannosyltransferase